MALEPDDTVCFCFHVSLRKIETFCQREQPKVASQISDCLSAGTGCGWCVPLLKRIHARCCPTAIPWWRQIEPEDPFADPEPSPEQRKAERKKYLEQGKGKPPAGAEE